MKQESKRFFGGVILGAIVGGAITLLDKETRKAVFEGAKDTSENISYYIKNPNILVEQVKETTHKLRSTVAQVSDDVSFIAEKVEELKEMTPAVAEIVKDTQESFMKGKNEMDTELGNKPF